MASGILRTSLFINYIINLLTKHSSHQYNYVRIAVFLSNNEQIFLLLFKIMISQVRKPFGTTMLKIFLKFGKFSRSFFIFVCPLGEKVPAWASHSWSRPARPRTVGEYEYCLLRLTHNMHFHPPLNGSSLGIFTLPLASREVQKAWISTCEAQGTRMNFLFNSELIPFSRAKIQFV